MTSASACYTKTGTDMSPCQFLREQIQSSRMHWMFSENLALLPHKESTASSAREKWSAVEDCLKIFLRF